MFDFYKMQRLMSRIAPTSSADVTRFRSHLVFKNPVPVQYALEQMKSEVTVSTAASLLQNLEACEDEA